MKAIVQTQHYENYAWREDGSLGTGAEAYWKPKGGDTYIFNCSIQNNMDREWWTRVEKACTIDSDEFREYSIGETVVDDIDFSVSDHCPEWDAPWYGTVKDGMISFHRTQNNTEYGYMRKEIAKIFEAYDVLLSGKRVYHPVSYEMINGDIVLFKDLQAWMDKYAPEVAA